MKKLIKFFLPVLLLLISGSGQTYALGFHSYFDYSISSESITHAQQLENFLGQDENLTYRSTLPYSQKEIIAEATETEVEEDEVAHSKRHLQGNADITALLSTLLSGYFFHTPENYFAFSSHLPNTISNKWYILFRVFRI